MAESQHPFGHEPSGIDNRRVLIVGAILAVVVLVAVSVIRIALTQWIVPQHDVIVARPAAVPPTPRLQPHPDNDLASLRAQKHALLSGYAWTDAAHDYARIPIERAMQIYAQRQAKPTPAGSASGATGQETQP